MFGVDAVGNMDAMFNRDTLQMKFVVNFPADGDEYIYLAAEELHALMTKQFLLETVHIAIVSAALCFYHQRGIK